MDVVPHGQNFGDNPASIVKKLKYSIIHRVGFKTLFG